MPTYTYRCSHCQKTFDRRNVPADERDDQRCDPRDCPLEGGPSRPADDPPRLERDFEAQVPPRMRYGWGEGQG